MNWSYFAQDSHHQFFSINNFEKETDYFQLNPLASIGKQLYQCYKSVATREKDGPGPPHPLAVTFLPCAVNHLEHSRVFFVFYFFCG